MGRLSTLTCPVCGDEALEVTKRGDSELQYLCASEAGHEWAEPFEDFDSAGVPQANLARKPKPE